MGYCDLHYDEYQSKIDYWNGELGLNLPKWADEISEIGESTGAIDFYNDIFGEDLEEHQENPHEYQKGEYAAIALEIDTLRDESGKPVSVAKRYTVTKYQTELFELIDRSDKFCAMAPISYAGRTRENKNARFLYALCVEIDNIQEKGGIKELIYSWERTNMKMPKPTYIVCSGSGLHLYLVFDRPIPLFKNIFEQLVNIKKYLTEWWWIKPISASYNKIQYESICQPFRLVGTMAKKQNKVAMAFKTGEKWTIEELNKLLPNELQLGVIYKSNLTKAQAKELYPDWYKRRILEGRPRKVFTRHEGIYHNWKQKMLQGAAVGARYNCLENLCSLGVQCRISPEVVEKDCRELAAYLESLTVEETNHFTEYDILCALRTYYKADEGAYRRRREFIAKRTGIELPENKRNYQPQKWHLEDIRAKKARMKARGQSFKAPEGRPVGSGTSEHIVMEWRLKHPDGRKIDCERETGLSRHTVLRWWGADMKLGDTAMDNKSLDFIYITEDGTQVLIEQKNADVARKQHNEQMKKYLDSLKSDQDSETENES